MWPCVHQMLHHLAAFPPVREAHGGGDSAGPGTPTTPAPLPPTDPPGAPPPAPLIPPPPFALPEPPLRSPPPPPRGLRPTVSWGGSWRPDPRGRPPRGEARKFCCKAAWGSGNVECLLRSRGPSTGNTPEAFGNMMMMPPHVPLCPTFPCPSPRSCASQRPVTLNGLTAYWATWGRTVRCARAVPKVGCFPSPVATGPRVLNSAPPMRF